MSRRSIDVELLCDICSLNFDLTLCRPKVLPCGHTICKKCLHNPALEKKCPTCRKDLTVGPEDHPDNVFIIRMMTDGDGSPPCKVPRKDNAKLEQLQRGLELGRNLVQQLQHMVPMAVAALNRQMESWAAQVRQLEEAVEREAAGGEEANSQELTTEQLELMAKLEDSVRLLTNDKSSVVAEGGECTWRASVQPGQFGNILHLLLLQLRADGPLEKVDDVAVSTNRAAFVGPPLISTLSIDKDRDIADGALKVKDILRDVSRWQNIRSLKNLSGSGSERLLRVVAPHLHELEFSEEVAPLVMEEVKEMTALKRLSVKCDDEMAGYPDLPFQLEELAIFSPCKSHLYNVQCMPGLRSLLVEDYIQHDVPFPRPSHGGLLWLSVALNVDHRATLRSLISAHAQSLQELQIYCCLNSDNDKEKFFYFPDLPQLLGTCGFQALRRLVLVRSGVERPCEEVDACLLQRRAIRKLLPSSVDVICKGCPGSVF